MGWATFAVRMPDIKRALEISNSQLGLVLFVSSLGVLGSLKLAGKWAAQYGSAPVMVRSASALAVMFPIVGTMPNIYVFGLTLFVLMFFTATMDVSMNAHAVAIEHGSGKLIMGRLHGLWSLGSMLGGVLGGTFATMELSLQVQSFLVCALIGIPVLTLRGLLLPATADKHEQTSEHREKHKQPVIFYILGAMGLCAAIGEGSAMDWGAVLLRDEWQASAFVASLPYIVFQAAMVTGRFSSDALTQKIGRTPVLLGCALIGGLGQILGLLVGGPAGVIFGWFCVGIGVSVVLPMVFSVSGVIARKHYAGVVAPSQAVATVSAISYSAFMIGPPLIGFVSDTISLRWAMLIPATLVLGIAFGARIAHDADA